LEHGGRHPSAGLYWWCFHLCDEAGFEHLAAAPQLPLEPVSAPRSVKLRLNGRLNPRALMYWHNGIL
jgi:hypothetical protein